MPAKITFRRGRKIGDPNYSSTDVGLEIVLNVDDEVFNDNPTFQRFCAANYSLLDDLVEAEVARIYSTRTAPVQTAAQREREPVAAGYRNGDGASHNGHSANGNGYTKPRTDWDRNRRPEAVREPERRPERRDDRERGRDDRRGGGKSYGPPKTGRELYAWAKRQEEENGVRGFVKTLSQISKERYGDWKFNDLHRDDLADLYEEGQRLLDGGEDPNEGRGSRFD